MERGERRLPEQELSRPAAVLAQRFLQRWDVYSKQLDDGSYVCIREPLNLAHLYAHLRGEITLGTYLLNQESKVRFLVLDNDVQDGWGCLVECGLKLSEDGIPAYLEKSRRGGHIWMFFKEQITGAEARAFAQAIAEKHHLGGFEIYPKQDEVGEGLGSLIRMPFGVHRLTGRRYGFFTSNGEPLGLTLREQIAALTSPQFVSEAVLRRYKQFLSAPAPKSHPSRLREPTEHVSYRLKAQVRVLEFVGKYVDLRPTANGAIGRCPFHDDRHPSFGVDDKENYWHCFAGCGGGSIIDFWSLWREKQGEDPSFTATVADLARMLF